MKNVCDQHTRPSFANSFVNLQSLTICKHTILSVYFKWKRRNDSMRKQKITIL